MLKIAMLVMALIVFAVSTSAQTSQSSIIYEYDASGNRTARRVQAPTEVCPDSYANQSVVSTTTVVACDNITVQDVVVSATLTIRATGVITIKNITMGSAGKLILDTQGLGRVVIEDKFDLLNSTNLEIK